MHSIKRKDVVALPQFAMILQKETSRLWLSVTHKLEDLEVVWDGAENKDFYNYPKYYSKHHKGRTMPFVARQGGERIILTLDTKLLEDMRRKIFTCDMFF